MGVATGVPQTQNKPSPNRVGPGGGAVTWASLAPKTKSAGRVNARKTTTPPPQDRRNGMDTAVGGHRVGAVPVRGPLVEGAGRRMAKAPPVEPEQGRPETDSTHPSSSFPTPHPITTSSSARGGFSSAILGGGKGFGPGWVGPGGPAKATPLRLRNGQTPSPLPTFGHH